VIDGLKTLLERGQLEFTGSAKYHPLLPKIPNEEIKRQILLNASTSRHYLGESYQPRGFFPPEMAYDRRVAQVVGEMGFTWIVGEELSYRHKLGAVKYDRLYEVEGIPAQVPGDKPHNLLMFFRERGISFTLLSGQLGTAKLFTDYLGSRLDDGTYLLTGMDGETFGHHRPGMEKQLLDIFAAPGVELVTISQLPELFKKREVVETQPATWALMETDLTKNIPFARWDDPDNEIHKLQWELTDLAIAVVGGSKFKSQGSNSGSGSSEEDERWLEARLLLDKALHSDQYWWASARPWWSLEMIERGARELQDTVLTVPDASEEDRKRARELYFSIITTGFDWQRKGKVDELSRKEDEEVRMRTDEGLPRLPAEELNKMIEQLRQEMAKVASNQEYERAAQLRDRIKELESYKS